MTPFTFDCWLQNGKKIRQNFSDFFIATSFGQVRLIDTGGTDLPLLVMVPDTPCFLEHFEELIAKARTEFRVIVFDMPGFGYSLPKNGYAHSFDQAVQVIDEILSAINLRNQKVAFAFSCVNGFYALRFAKLHPNRVNHIFLIQTPSFEAMRPWAAKSIPAALKIPYLGQLITYLLRKKIPETWFRIALPRHSDLAPQFIKKTLDGHDHGACNCLAGVVQGMFLMDESDLAGVKVPVTMLWGKKDFSHRMTDPDSIKSLVPNAKIVTREDLGHFTNLEDPDYFLNVVKSELLT